MNLFKLIKKIANGEVKRDLTPVVVETQQVGDSPPSFKPGEPVENMVRAYKKNRCRFVIKRKYGQLGGLRYEIRDKLTGEDFVFHRYRGYRPQRDNWMILPEWMTQEECEWAYSEIVNFNSERNIRLNELKAKRQELLNSRERQRIIELYKED